MKSKKLKLGIIGGGPNSWIGHVHRISSRFDDKYEIVAGVFSRNSKQSTSFGKSIGVSEDRCVLPLEELFSKDPLLHRGHFFLRARWTVGDQPRKMSFFLF